MTNSLYRATIPVFEQFLGVMSTMVDKAAVFAKSRDIAEADMLGWRLYPDMLPLLPQFIIACDTAKNATGRLSGGQPPRFEDTEKTFEDIKARIAKTLLYIRGVAEADVDAGEAREVTIPIGGGQSVRMQGGVYVRHWGLPNFFFHVVTAHDILRHNGVELGKRDFLGAVPGRLPA